VGNGVFQVLLSLLLTFFLFRDGEAAATRLRAALTRIAEGDGEQLLEVAGATVRSVLYGVVGTALLQGVLAAVGFAVAGVPGASFLGFITFLVSAIPAGPLAVGAVAAFWLSRQGATAWALFLIIWTFLVSAFNNVVQPLLISRSRGTTPVIVLV